MKRPSRQADECPECDGGNIESETNHAEYDFVCSDCGYGWSRNDAKSVGEFEEAERKRRVLENAEEMSVDWRAPFGTLLDQTDQFVIAQTLQKNRFALLDIQSGELIKEVELVHNQNEVPAEEQNEWEPDAGIHWCVSANALFTFDDSGVRRYSGSDADPTWTIKERIKEVSEEQLCCAYVGGVLFVATPHEVCAIQATTGEISCRYRLSGRDNGDLRLLPHQGTLYLSDGADLVSLDIDSGAENWTHKIGDTYRDQRVIQFGGIEENVLLTVEESDTNYVCGYDVESGDQLWAFQDRHDLSIMQTQDGAVYVDCEDGVLLCLNVGTGVLRWQHQFRKLVFDDHKQRARKTTAGVDFFEITHEGIVTCNHWGTVYLLDPETGYEEWELFPEDSDGGPEGTCRVVEDTIIRIKGTKIESFDLCSGEEQWSFEMDATEPIARDGPVVVDGYLYFTDYDGTLYGVGAEASGLQRVYHAENDEQRSLTVGSEHIYVASLDPNTNTSAHRKSQEASTETTYSGRPTDSRLNLHALLR